jgi:hypothetical protein
MVALMPKSLISKLKVENNGRSFTFLKSLKRTVGVFLVLTAAAIQTACISLDKRISTEAVNKTATRSLDARFSIHPSYYTNRGKSQSSDELSSFFGFFNRVDNISSIDSIQLTLTNAEALTIKFLAGNKAVGGGTYTVSDGLEFDSEGRIQLPSKVVFLGIGGSSRKAVLSLNAAGDLVVALTHGGGGILIMIPIVAYSQQMWIFPRMR